MTGPRVLPSRLMIAVIVAGCNDITAGNPPGRVTEQHLRAQREGEATPFETIDDRFARLADEVIGFGGLFYDGSGQLTVYLKHPETLDAERPQLQDFLSGLSASNTARLSDLPHQVRSARALPARYDFRELLTYYRGQIVPYVAPLPGVTMTDIDDRENRITIGVSDAGARIRVEEALRGLSIPPEAVAVIEIAGLRIARASLKNSRGLALGAGSPSSDRREPIRPSGSRGSVAAGTRAANTLSSFYSLTDELRPVPGGARVQWESGVQAFDCTLTYNLLLRDPVSGVEEPGFFMTNSHCTDVFGSVTDMWIGQPTVAQTIGYELLDPPLRTAAEDSLCPPGRWCRSSDAAAFRYFSETLWDHPWVAFPPVGSVEFNEWRKVRHIDYPLVGMVATMIGSESGRIDGEVYATCFDSPQLTFEGDDTGRTMLCQALADFDVDFGNSGSPVVLVNSDGSLTDLGILWGGPVFSKQASYWTEFSKTYDCCFESFGRSNPNVRTTETDPLTVTIDGPSVVPEGTYCTYIAQVAGGTGVYSYAWSRNGVSIGEDSQYVEVYTGDLNSYTLRVDVTDSNGLQDSDELEAVVDPNAMPCFT